MPRSRLIIIGAGVFLIVLIAAAFIFLTKNGNGGEVVKLTFWGVFDSKRTFDEVLALLPGYEVSYREFDPATYESELINALAAGRGPDVFMVHNSWIPKHFDKLAPASPEFYPISALRSIYPTVVEQDFAPDGIILALPLYLDTLALFYNDDIFDSSGIALPPKTWVEFQNLIPRLRELDKTGRLVRAAAAIGGSNKNINRATDLLSAIMLQSGVPMVSNDFSRAEFADSGEESFSFYAGFGNPASANYTWSDSFFNSIDSFGEEKTVMIFNYAHQISILRAKNPILNFSVAPLPQPSGAAKKITFPNYWGLAVSSRFFNYDQAWGFVAALASEEVTQKKYGELTGRLPALRSLLNQKLNDPDLGVFASQALYARSWPRVDNSAVDRILSKMIDDVTAGRSTVKRAIEEAESEITNLMEKRRRTF